MQTQFVGALGLFENLGESLRIDFLSWLRLCGIERPVRGLAYSVKLLNLSLKQAFLAEAAVHLLLLKALLIFQILLIVEHIVEGGSSSVHTKFPHRKLSLDCLGIKRLLVQSIIKLDH